MKFNRRHFVGAAILLLASVIYNVWVFWGPSSEKKPKPAVTPTAFASAGAAGGSASVDPLTISPPPRVDLGVAPEWNRDPFRRAGEGAPPPKPPEVAPPVAPAPAPDPVVGAILFSADRRLAIINRRIVAVGDRIDSGVIVDITRDAILVRAPDGGERRLPLRVPKLRESPK